MVRRVVLLVAVTLAVSCGAAWAQAPVPGKNKVVVRGQAQDLYFYPGAGPGPHRKVLFAPGDGGWRGFAITIAENLAEVGYDVFGLDTRHYLESFTGSGGLQPADIAADYRTLAHWMVPPGSRERVLLVGWSEGAGFGVAAASDPNNRDVFVGLVAVGLTEYNILGWRWRDIGAEITKSLPNEPTFKSADYITQVTPLPLVVIASRRDEYVPPEMSQKLYAAAGQPKRFVLIDGGDHKYSGKTDEFFAALRDSLNWIQQPHR